MGQSSCVRVCVCVLRFHVSTEQMFGGKRPADEETEAALRSQDNKIKYLLARPSSRGKCVLSVALENSKTSFVTSGTLIHIITMC